MIGWPYPSKAVFSTCRALTSARLCCTSRLPSRSARNAKGDGCCGSRGPGRRRRNHQRCSLQLQPRTHGRTAEVPGVTQADAAGGAGRCRAGGNQPAGLHRPPQPWSTPTTVIDGGAQQEPSALRTQRRPVLKALQVTDAVILPDEDHLAHVTLRKSWRKPSCGGLEG